MRLAEGCLLGVLRTVHRFASMKGVRFLCLKGIVHDGREFCQCGEAR